MLALGMLVNRCDFTIAMMDDGTFTKNDGFPSNLTRRLKALRSQQMGQTDQRVLQINEALLSIRVVKSNCWEEPIAQRISVFRKVELER